ncbi:DUF1648 domain-containing protein [Chryseobacterium sp.]|uniref:DUF1648 domain-containing protein n=1 Tax=Chryseobacterium sp. TaxID=1871047 RepID=UPI0028A18D71|nr:DUF1648 domain-containing protein [Chryseobacterium sp.]
MGVIFFYLFDFLNLLIVLLLWVYTIRMYKKLPEKIPTHFDFEGKPDQFGKKGFAFFLPVLSVAFYITFIVITQNPENGNFPIQLTEANHEIQFFIMILMLKWLLFLVVLMFLNIQDYMLRYSLDSQAKAKVHILLFLPFIFVSIMSAIIFSYIYK